MATLKEITALCKAGQPESAYAMAKADWSVSPQNIWSQRGMGWALYYLIKSDVEEKRQSDFWAHLEELVNLDLLTPENDPLIFDTTLWCIAEFIKGLSPEKPDDLDHLFSLIRKYSFNPSKGYSFLLKVCLNFETWERWAEFLEWWNMDKLLPEDYQPVKLKNGRSIISLAERTYIAYAKVLLKLNDRERIGVFLPKIEKLMDDYPSMLYPGYFCGKLMLAMGAEKDEALESVLPFVRKKRSEFWVWQLLSEIYQNESEIHLACLLRAIHCKTQETFLGKVRMKLAAAYLQKKDSPRAKFQIEQIVQCYTSQQWRLPHEVQNWLKEPWAQQGTSDGSDGMDYKQPTDAILLHGTNEDIAIVTYIDPNKKLAAIVYGYKQRRMVKLSNLPQKVRVGSIIKLYWLPVNEKDMNIVKTRFIESSALKDTSYIQSLTGLVERIPDRLFAFVKGNGIECFIPPHMVHTYRLENSDCITALAVYNYNKKKQEWSWSCVSLTTKKK